MICREREGRREGEDEKEREEPFNYDEKDCLVSLSTVAAKTKFT